MKKHSEFREGVTAGIPIALGYFSVSFGFGITAVRLGLSVLSSVIISLTNLTSAGQAQGVQVMAAHGTLLLMAISLSQNLDKKFTLRHRFIAAYGITDEIFALCSTRQKPVTPAYMYGITVIASFGWTMGTLLGAAAGEVLPARLIAALGLMLYGMFIAIIVPPAAKEKSVLLVIITASVLSTVCYYLLPFLSGGFAVILCSVAASLIGALLFPIKEEASAS